MATERAAERAAEPDGHRVAVLDDIDARPGSTASLLRTLIGVYLRPLGGWISAADLVALAGDLSIPTAQARTGIARLKQKGLLLAERTEAIGYRLNPAAIGMLERGDRRIFEMREMTDADTWCLVSFSIPESARSVRHQLRRRLLWIGAGTVSPALWICPGHLQDEVLEIVDDLDARAWVTLFQASAPVPPDSLVEAAAQWWDLAALRAEHLAFQESLTTLPAEPFAARVQLIDRWRVLPYTDPGLPPSMLPADWPGRRSFDEFARLSAALAEPAWEHVRTLTRRAAPSSP
ncbi:PaaX family transcriptional regulator C-terminal domain-containing protein [Microbacterium sp. W4I20]|uniref:PaaX family transcriptional regulator n=1 Tax=Microbacterium sp. W4I20 TaxID=3042262 RepID=UPI002789DE69|nr:PaaX family transcriptional regulator C-terminal domain-containing protein [Microbacterium sp. W4I20]MDQ0728350.1 phenylacetic acid degradation operon negative regulatory protein [Microbacterium sp. W4I20]